MVSASLVVAAAIVALYVGNTAVAFLKQLRAARASGLPYIVIPFLSFRTLPRLTTPLWRPLVDFLPEPTRTRWLARMAKEHYWNYGHNRYKTLAEDADTEIVVTWSGEAMLVTSDPAVIMEVTTRKNDFWKPVSFYKILDIYGRNVLSVEGHTWRRHRKVVGPPFTERNNHLVWSESLYAAQAMVDSVMRPDGTTTDTVDDLEPHFGRVALAVISKAGYGVRLGWPSRDGSIKNNNSAVDDGDSTSSDPALNRAWVEGKTHGHTMSFGDAILGVSHRIIPIVITPHWLLKRLPFKSTRLAWKAYTNWGNYMREMIVAKKKQVGADGEGASKQSYDLLANLVRSAADTSLMLDASDSSKSTSSREKGDDTSKKPVESFSDEEILGNAFLLIVAGHETSAGALQHLTLFLAMDPAQQRHLQKDLDQLLGGRPPSKWDYEHDFPRLFGGFPGAILAETLRILPPALAPPKTTKHDTYVTVDGKRHAIPGSTPISLDIASVQRNPRHWKTQPANPDAPQYTGEHGGPRDGSHDLAEFKPQRWLLSEADQAKTSEAKMPENKISAEEAALGVNLAADNAATLLKPVRGAYLPFMEGYRACMGRRFAQVEVMAIMAVLFQSYSVELAVDRWASDDEVSRMTVQEKREVWRKARAAAQGCFRDGMVSIITCKMLEGSVPVRFVKRGEERFPVDLW